MALVIEDGTGVANATSFVTVDEYKAWLQARGYTVPADDAIEPLAIKAMDYLATREDELDGDRLFDTQSLPFPRTGAYLRNVLVEDGDIPAEVKTLQFAIMYAIQQGINFFPTTGDRTIKRKKVGPLETEWFSDSLDPIASYVDASFGPLLGGFGSFALTVRRV